MAFNFPKIPEINIPKIDIPNNDMYKPNYDPTQYYTPKSILILGNGFDIDLGINTRYKDFVNSEDWPFNKPGRYEEDSLPYFLNECLGSVETWYDLEEALAKFADKSKNHLERAKIDRAKMNFITLCSTLGEYLKKQENAYITRIKGQSNAKRLKPSQCLLKYFLNKEIRSIYTFNYTNLKKIANQFILSFNDDYTHVHGSLENDNIILGAGDQRDLNDDFFEFYKTASPIYESNNLVEDLNSADEVYIFGHSLGLNDHDYFSEFFKMASQTLHRPFSPGKIKVRIFTYDDTSEIAIKKQLMTLTDKHLTGLYAHCDFKILKTCSDYQDEWMLHQEIL
jgi:hypothetical protein